MYKKIAKIAMIILIILCALNLVHKLVTLAPYNKQVNSVITKDAYTAEEIEQIVKDKLEGKNPTSQTLVYKDGKYVKKENKEH